MEKNDLIFDSRTLLTHRTRAGRSFKLYDFMMQEVANRLTERLLETNRNFDTGVGICWQNKILQEAINSSYLDLLNCIVVYAVEDEHNFSDKKGNILPDSYVIKKGSTAKDLALSLIHI